MTSVGGAKEEALNYVDLVSLCELHVVGASFKKYIYIYIWVTAIVKSLCCILQLLGMNYFRLAAMGIPCG